MAELVIMPKLGFNMNEGKLVKWYKKPGDEIKKGEPFFSIETDKTNIDIEATVDGFVRKQFIGEGDKLAVTLPIAIVGGKDENIDELLNEACGKLKNVVPEEKIEKVKEKQKVKEYNTDKLMASPRAKRVAKEKGIDLYNANIKGTGFQGGISEKDVLDYLASVPEIKASPLAKKIAEVEGLNLSQVRGSGVNDKILKRDLENVLSSTGTASELQDKSSGSDKEILERVPYEGVRRIIGERLSGSMFTAPHVFFTRKINLENLLELRKQVNNSLDFKTSVTDFIARAVIIVLQKYPELNSSLVGDEIERYKSVNLGIAVASPSGLIVPVIKNSQKMSLAEISKVSSGLIDKARQGKLTPDEYSGGTFTISNLGMFGIDNFTAIINPPEAGILAVSATKDEAIVILDENGDKRVEIKPIMNITLSVDHRIIDGLLAAQVVKEIKELLENPIRLLV